MKVLISVMAATSILCAGIILAPLPAVDASDCTKTSVNFTPINDLGSGIYREFTGGLYPAGSNQIPDDHLLAGLESLDRIQPLDANGEPSPSGKFVLLSIGMSNTSNEFCGGPATNCAPESFVAQAAADMSVNQSTLVIVNGAQGGRDAVEWISPSASTYDVIRTTRLGSLGLTEEQVQIVWLKHANARPAVSLPDPNADAYLLESYFGMIVRALKVRYPNLQQVFLSSRIYAGYASSELNPEPYSYESGFSVKWLIESQIHQMRGGSPDPVAGDLDYNTVAPWLAWGPYLWADGTVQRSDGLTWQCQDLNSDGTHPAESGRWKVGTMLLDFFKRDSTARSWFLASSAATVSVSGQIMTPDGRGIRGAVVRMADNAGMIRSTITSSLGFYGFSEVSNDRSYTISISSKRYRFGSKKIAVTSDLTDVDFAGLE